MPAELLANKYQIVREIARSNDVVYEAINTTMGRRVAVKELNIPANLTGQARRERIERFNREARAAGKLTHPNIVTVYAFGEFEGRHFIEMEYLEGQTLRDVLQTRGQIPLQEAVDIATQVLSALAHAHSRQVVHRDIKPDNIQILPGGVIKLTDFGIARLTEEASLTGDGQVFGTPSYMSPEQIEGRFIDHRSDLFSLGIVLYEMLAGRKPFTGDSVVSITYSIMHSEPTPLVGVPYGIEQAVFRALAKDPGRRYSSAEEMRNALKNADSVPSMFFPRQPTHLGGMGAPGMGGSHPSQLPPIGMPAWQGGVPGYGPGAAGYSGQPQPPYGQTGSVPPGTAYHPPPQSAPPTSGGGPFVNWQTGAPGPQAGYVPPPPPFPRAPSGPLISEGTKTFFKMMIITLVLSGAVVAFVLLFLRAYEQQRTQANQRGVEELSAHARKLYESGKLAEAAKEFDQAYRMGPSTKAGDNARVSLAVTLTKMGTAAFKAGRMKDAEELWTRAQTIDPKNEDAPYNLGLLYDRMGDRDRAMLEWQHSSNSDRVGGPNPAGPSDQTAMQSRIERASALYKQGMDYYNQGDTQRAREFWQQAVAEAPGSPGALKAQQYLDQTTTGPNF